MSASGEQQEAAPQLDTSALDQSRMLYMLLYTFVKVALQAYETARTGLLVLHLLLLLLLLLLPPVLLYMYRLQLGQVSRAGESGFAIGR
jgi:endonuclease/exonuclease/phosphatase (EEP) superfamily protein YafD